MKPNEFEEKVHELEEALNERMGEVARTKTSEADNQELSVIQQRIKTFRKRFQDCLSKFQGMSSSMRVDGRPAAMASSVALR
jgi:hypothetical protein